MDVAGGDRSLPVVTNDENEARAALVLSLRRRGIRDRNVLSAIERVPRRLFLTARYHRLAYEDCPLPIECGQTVLSPSMVATMVNELRLTPDHDVLEIGTGSGYQTAVLSHLAARVISLDRYSTLVELASKRLAALKIRNVRVRQGDGLKGYPDGAPFDRIIMTGAVREVPDVVLQQLSTSGMLLAAVGQEAEPQVLTRVIREGASFRTEQVGPMRTVMLQDGMAELL